MDEHKRRRAVRRWKMISDPAVAKKGNDMLAEVGLKLWIIERSWVMATFHAINPDSGIDLSPVRDIATKDRA